MAPYPVGSDVKYRDITAPIMSTQLDYVDVNKTASLVKALETQGCFEGEMDVAHRMEIVANLDHLVKQWITDLSIEKNMPPSLAHRVGGHVYTFGSLGLGVQNKWSDIDALCVVPIQIHHEDFFGSFYSVLHEQPNVTKLRAVKNAYVPVIKMVYDGIDIDMTFARLALNDVKNKLPLSYPEVLKHCDSKCVRSLNGYFVTDKIINLVPNKDNFRLTLRAIRAWAKKHGIYSNVLGYLGGVSWAILVARVCQLYPNADCSILLHKFFLMFSKWPWPKPVQMFKLDHLHDLVFR